MFTLNYTDDATLALCANKYNFILTAVDGHYSNFCIYKTIVYIILIKLLQKLLKHNT